MKGIPREAYYIATKIGRYGPGPSGFDFSAKKTKESVDISLSYLGLEYVDIIQIHDVEFAENLDIVVNEALPVLEELRVQGKVKFIGFSGYPLSPLKDTILKAPGRFDVSNTNRIKTIPDNVKILKSVLSSLLQTVLAYSRYTMLDESLLEYLPFFLVREIIFNFRSKLFNPYRNECEYHKYGNFM